VQLSGLTRPTGPKRPWLAALLALAVTGLGHAYLRRWLRGFGWLATTYAVALLFVPPEAVEALTSGTPAANPGAALPPLAAILASAADAYLLARRTRTGSGTVEAAGESGAADTAEQSATGRDGSAHGTPDGEAASCPACGKDLDADLDFCPWCTAELDRAGPNGGGGGR